MVLSQCLPKDVGTVLELRMGRFVQLLSHPARGSVWVKAKSLVRKGQVECKMRRIGHNKMGSAGTKKRG